MFFNNYFNTFLFVLLFVITLSAQQFTLEATIDNAIKVILDLDNDGICEYFIQTGEDDHENDIYEVYDGLTHQMKYSFVGYLNFGDVISANNPNFIFPHIDFNSDGTKEIIIRIDSSLVVLDLKNNQKLFEFNPPEGNSDNPRIIDDNPRIIDIDGDGVLELIIGEYYVDQVTFTSQYNTYVYSTGVSLTNLEKPTNPLNSNYKLEQNYPNPFNPSTTINYKVPKRSNIKIRIYDINGQMIKEIINEEKKSGNYSIKWDGQNEFGAKVASGTYFYQIQSGDFVQAKKMILLK